MHSWHPTWMSIPELPHLDDAGRAKMVDVADKPATRRVAVASATVRLSEATVEAIRKDTLRKGDALAVARIAGLAAVKKTPDLLPLAHPIQIVHAAVDLRLEAHGVDVTARVESIGPTGVEMEAMVAVSVAALNIYDMVKSQDRSAAVAEIVLVEKSGGRSGHYRREPRTATEAS